MENELQVYQQVYHFLIDQVFQNAKRWFNEILSILKENTQFKNKVLINQQFSWRKKIELLRQLAADSKDLEDHEKVHIIENYI